MKKAYQRIDVNVFKEILREKYCPTAEKGASKKVLLEIIREISKVIIKIKGNNLNKNEIIGNINFKEFGFKEQSDVKIKFTETVFGHTELTLQAKKIYELQEGIELPIPRNNKQKQYQTLLSDTFERLKIKCENIISDTDEQKHIELYANKNIQTITRIFYEAKTLLYKCKEKLNDKDRFYIYVQTLFILNTVLFMQNMFSSYYKEKNYSKRTLKLEMYDAVGPDLFSEPTAGYGNSDSNDNKFKWMVQINQLATFYYDLNKSGLIESTPKQLEDHIVNNYVDKNGNAISRATIKTCLNEYRPDKRAKGKKRIDISKYIEME
jgi:hypothetical protein